MYIYWQKKNECQPSNYLNKIIFKKKYFFLPPIIIIILFLFFFCFQDCYLKPHKDYFIAGHDTKYLPRKSLLECQEACLLWKPFECKSVDYSANAKTCYLSIETRYTQPAQFKKLPNGNQWHFEKKCPIYGCFETYDNQYFQLSSPLVKIVKDEDECIEKCMYEKSFRCLSVQYNKVTRECQLFDAGRESIDTSLRDDPIFSYFSMKKSCRTTCKLRKYYGSYLNIRYTEKVKAHSDLECLEYCLSSKKPCKSVQRHNKTHECFLHTETKETQPSRFRRNAKYQTYWDWDCGCFDEHRQMFLQSLNTEQVPGVTAEKCKLACLNAKFRCKSAEFNTLTNQCYLSKETRLTKPGSFRSNPNYYHWTRKVQCEPECYMEAHKNYYLKDHNSLEKFNMKGLDCLEMCYFSKSLNCKSVEYNNVTRKCLLSTETKDTKPNNFLKKDFVTYYQRVCHNNYHCFSSSSKRYMMGAARIFKAKSERDCVKSCLDGGFLCRSASYQTVTRDCRLSLMTKDTHPENYSAHNNYVYFEKQMDCRTDCYFNRFPDYSLESQQLYTKRTADEMECIKTCLTYKPLGTCKSARRSTKTGICVLHRETRLAKPSKFKKVKGIVYWELTCGDKCFEEKPFKFLDGYESVTIEASSLRKCKDACLSSNIACRSANFNQLTNICYLSIESSKTKPNALKIGSNWIFMERRRDCLPKCYMKGREGYYLMGFNKQTIKVNDEYECKKLCFLNKEKNCLSAEYHKPSSICYINTESHLTKPSNFQKNSNYIYWYKKCGKDYPCFKKYLGYGFDKHYYTILTGKTEETCSRACFMSYCR